VARAFSGAEDQTSKRKGDVLFSSIARFLLVLAALVIGVSACGGGDGDGEGGGDSGPSETGSTEATTFTPQQVKAQLERELGLFVDFDPAREDADASVLTTNDESYGTFSIWVFKPGRAATDFLVGDVPVAPKGQTSWSDWEALDKKFLPGEGSYSVLKNYGNVVLSYFVDAKEGKAPTEMPGGFLLLDQAFSKLTGVPATSAVEGTNAPKAEAVVYPDPEFDADAVEETVRTFEKHPAWRNKLTSEGRNALKLIERYWSKGLAESQIGDVGGAIAQVQIETAILEQGQNPAAVLGK